MDGHWKGGGVGISKAKTSQSVKLNWNFWRGGVGVQTKKPSVEWGVDIFWNHSSTKENSTDTGRI